MIPEQSVYQFDSRAERAREFLDDHWRSPKVS